MFIYTSKSCQQKYLALYITRNNKNFQEYFDFKIYWKISI